MTDKLIIKDKEMQKAKKELLKSVKNYHKMMAFMSADAPIGILCLPKDIETILCNQGCLRVYDLLNRDFTKIKGIGKRRIGHLTSRLDQFFSMS